MGPKTSIPSNVTVQLYLQGTPVPGATTRHTFTASSEVATVSFDIPFRVDSTPANISLITDTAGFLFGEKALTILRLGNAT